MMKCASSYRLLAGITQVLNQPLRQSFPGIIPSRYLATANTNVPTIEFYQIPPSPPCRAVSMMAEIAGVKLNTHLINLTKREHLTEEYAKINWMQKVPYIIDGDVRLGESRAIMAYIANRYMPDDNTVYPRDPIKRAKVDEMLYYESGTIYQAGLNYAAPFLNGGTPSSQAEKNYRSCLERFDSFLAKNRSEFLVGDNLTIVDLSYAATFAFVEAVEFNLSEYSHISKYFERLKKKIPNYNEINDEPMKNLRTFIKSMQSK